MRNVCARAFATRVLFLAVFATLFASTFGCAQQVSRWDIFGGYSYMRFDSVPIGFAGPSNLDGWNAAAAYNWSDTLSLAVDASGHYGNQITTYNYAVAPQYSYRWERSRVFGQALFGKAQNTVDIVQPTRTGFESVGLAYGAGAGFDWDYNSRFTIRAIQVDYLRDRTFRTSEGNIRVSAGLVVHFGRTHKKRRL
jgi:hypothetical protein